MTHTPREVHAREMHPMRCTLIRSMPVRYSSVRYTPMRCMNREIFDLLSIPRAKDVCCPDCQNELPYAKLVNGPRQTGNRPQISHAFYVPFRFTPRCRSLLLGYYCSLRFADLGEPDQAREMHSRQNQE
jgi:hypothetical protein